MDAKTPDKLKPMAEGDKSAPAFVIRTAAQVGRDRTIELTFGAPMDMTPRDLHAYTDKAMSIIERQNNKGLLREYELRLEAANDQLRTNIEQQAAAESKYRLDFDVGNRRGEWKPTGQQAAELRNFGKTQHDLRDVTIPKIKREIEDLKRKINEDV